MKHKTILHYTNGKSYHLKGDWRVELDNNNIILTKNTHKKIDCDATLHSSEEIVVAKNSLASIEKHSPTPYGDSISFFRVQPTFKIRGELTSKKSDKVIKVNNFQASFNGAPLCPPQNLALDWENKVIC